MPQLPSSMRAAALVTVKGAFTPNHVFPRACVAATGRATSIGQQALAAEVGVSPNALSPSAAIAATLVPGTIHAYMTGYVVSMCESDTNAGVRPGESLSVRKGSVMCEFVTPGVQRALVFHAK